MWLVRQRNGELLPARFAFGRLLPRTWDFIMRELAAEAADSCVEHMLYPRQDEGCTKE
jgi:hypothetical protein